MKSLAIIIAFAVAASADLLPFAFAPLPLGSIQPQGWLLDQMQLMADGLAGHEYDFYLYVNESSWLGGDQEYSNLNEGFPYWFNALVPLAYGLNDDRLKSQVQAAATYVLQHQADDGWIGPETGDARIMWARFPALLGFMQLAEAEQTMTDMVVAGMQKFAVCMNNMLTANYTGYLGTSDDLWGRARFQDMIISLQWLYEHYPQDNGQILLDNMQMLTEAGYDWAYWFLDAFIKENLYDVSLDITNALFQFEHGVNAGQGLKSGAVIRRFTNNDTLLASTRQGVDWTFKYHGAASGTILADERLDGLSPMTGQVHNLSELCTAVETMYSLSYLYEALGDNDFADRSERAAFNALPTMLTADWWAHQYMAEPNQGYSQDLTESPFWNVNTLGQTFGLEPNYPCCAVNHPQGYPKFLSNSFVTVGNNGLGHALLSPATATSTLPGGNKVTVSCNTKYPFDFSLSYTASASSAFDLYLRVPGWALSSSVSVNSGASSPLKPDRHTGMAKVSLPAGQSIVEYTLSADTTLDLRANNTVAVYHGPLLYALQIGEDIIAQPPRNWGNQSDYPSGYAPTQSHDYTINNLTAWNIAIDPSTISYQVNLSAGSDPLPNPIWTSGGPPGFMTFRGCEIAWPIEKGVPTNPPQDRTCTAAPTEYTMIPYGAAKLHMAEMPIVNLTSQRVRGLI